MRACTRNSRSSTAIAGIFGALRTSKQKLTDQRILFLGGGSAAPGIAELISEAMSFEGFTMEQGRARNGLFGIDGLMVSSRTDVGDFQRPFAHKHAPMGTFLEAIEAIRPTCIIGVSTVPKLFGQPVIEAMLRPNERPNIFPYSNPTSRPECTAEEAYKWSNSWAIFASGTPFPPVEFGGGTFVPGQGNNVYIFPAMGMAVLATEAKRVTQSMFICAAKSVAAQVTDEDLASGLTYPPQSRILDASLNTATRLAELVFDSRLAAVPQPANVGEYVRAAVYRPVYRAELWGDFLPGPRPPSGSRSARRRDRRRTRRERARPSRGIVRYPRRPRSPALLSQGLGPPRRLPAGRWSHSRASGSRYR